MRDLLQQIGQITGLVYSDSFGSDGAGATNDGQIRVNGHKGLLFVFNIGDVAAGVSGTASLVYSSTGSAAGSDYAELAGATDFVTIDTDTANSIRLIDLALDDGKVVVEAGKFAVSVTGDSDGSLELGVVVIPYGGNTLRPASQANTPTET